ncbi:MAG: HAD-IC family P-type ATPase, partial [Muribaculaceae bacterium]|nr:HAD-IC family P-type ATPase [Muribaculaceae bacterium]
ITYPEHLGHTSETIVACAIDGKYAGPLFLSDRIKPDSNYAISGLPTIGIDKICLLSGDKKEVVEEYARKLGINDAHGGLLPENKSEYIEHLINSDNRKVAFVGDGMNDAPVLALSNVGVAMGGLGSDAAVESADIVIQDDSPSKLVTAIKIGRTTRTIVKENIIGAIVIKIIVMIAGAAGYATLWGAVFADVGVALLAVLNALRILYKKYDR